MTDRSYVIGPGLKLYCTPSGWYTFEWDWPDDRRPDLRIAAEQLQGLIRYGDLKPATRPRTYIEDSYRTPEEALEDLKKHISEGGILCGKRDPEHNRGRG